MNVARLENALRVVMWLLIGVNAFGLGMLIGYFFIA